MHFDLLIFTILLLYTLVTCWACSFKIRGLWQRYLLLGFGAGFLFYSGISIAYKAVPLNYLFYYLLFLLVFCFNYRFFNIIFSGLGVRVKLTLPAFLNNLDKHPLWLAVIGLFLLLHLLPLLYPHFRLNLLITPPAPDLNLALASRFEAQGTNLILSLAGYARILLQPFFYIALYRFRHMPVIVALFIGLVTYFSYIDTGYIGRSYIIIPFALVWLFLWLSRPPSRRVLLAATALLLPLFFYALFLYQVIRLGGTAADFNLPEAARVIVVSETAFLRDVGLPLIDSGARVDLTEYFRWIITLPVPKLFTGEVEGARINYEISQVILGKAYGDRGWYITLPGLLAESIYIYGPYFFWLHAAFIAFFAALAGRIVEGTPQLLFLKLYLLLHFVYVINRAGIAALLPVIINHMLLFYLLLAALILIVPRDKLKTGQAVSSSENELLCSERQAQFQAPGTCDGSEGHR